MQKTAVITALLCAAVISVATYVSAETSMSSATVEHHKRFSWFHPHHFEKIAKQLELTTEQKQAIDKLHDQAKKLIYTKREEFHKIKDQVNQEFKDDTITKIKIDMYYEKEKQLLDDMLKIILTERFDAFSILNEKQKTKLLTIVNKWETKHKQHHEIAHDLVHD